MCRKNHGLNTHHQIAVLTRENEDAVRLDAAQMKQAIHNLIRNAFQVMPKVGILSISGSYTGTGLRIIREHGREIDIESRVGQGTRVSLWLPLVERKVRLLGEGKL